MIEIKNSQISRTPLFFEEKHGAIYAVFHQNTDSNFNSDTVLIICPPVGIEYMNSHRSLRHLADNIAMQGLPCIRLDYLGTGNSADCPQTDDINNYLTSIESTHNFVKRDLEFKHVALLGFRFGAALATLAAEKFDIRFLILWAGIYQGRQLVREIRMLQKASAIEDSNPANLEAGGWVITPSTKEAIQKIDINNTSPRTDNVLILTTETSKHQQLEKKWGDENKIVKVVNTHDVADMIVDAHQTKIPRQSIKNILEWISHIEQPSSDISSKTLKFETSTTATIDCFDVITKDDFQVSESLHFFDNGLLQFYIKTTPLKDTGTNLPIVLLLNSGSNHHVGPHRLYVTISRMLAQQGFTCISMDLPGLGESIVTDEKIENKPYMEHPTSSIQACIDDATKPGQSIVLMGLCSGAYHAFLGSIELDKAQIIETVLINPLTFYWEQGMVIRDAPSKIYSSWNWYQKNSIYDKNKWRNLLTDRSKIIPILNLIRKVILISLKSKLNYIIETFDNSPNNKISKSIRKSLQKITNKGIHLTIFFSENDPGVNILKASANRYVKKLVKKDKIKISYIANSDHTFSKSAPRNKLLSYIYKHFTSLK